jgi:hypothetical protein
MVVAKIAWLLFLEETRERIGFAWNCALPFTLFVLYRMHWSGSAAEERALVAGFLSYVLLSHALFSFVLHLVWRREAGFLRSFCVEGLALPRLVGGSFMAAVLGALLSVAVFLVGAGLVYGFWLTAREYVGVLGMSIAVCSLCCAAVLGLLLLRMSVRGAQSLLSGLLFVWLGGSYGLRGAAPSMLQYFDPIEWGRLWLEWALGAAPWPSWHGLATVVLAAVAGGIGAAALKRATLAPSWTH